MSFISSIDSVPLNSIISIMAVVVTYRNVSGLAAAQFETHYIYPQDIKGLPQRRCWRVICGIYKSPRMKQLSSVYADYKYFLDLRKSQTPAKKSSLIGDFWRNEQ